MATSGTPLWTLACKRAGEESVLPQRFFPSVLTNLGPQSKPFRAFAKVNESKRELSYKVGNLDALDPYILLKINPEMFLLNSLSLLFSLVSQAGLKLVMDDFELPIFLSVRITGVYHHA